MLTVNDLPEPSAFPLLGHLPALARGPAMHRVLHDWRDTYGPIYRIRFGRTPLVVTSSPNIVQTVLRERPGAFRRAPLLAQLIHEIGAPGLFDAEGEDWHRMRQIAMRGLRAEALRDSFSVIIRSVERLQMLWAATGGARVDVLDDLMRYTVEVSTALFSGHDLDAVGPQQSDGLAGRLPLAFEKLGRRISSPIPYWRWVRLPADRRLDATIAELRGLVEKQYVQARRSVAEGREPVTYLEALAEAGANGGEQLAEKDVVSAVVNMIVAGEDNTAAAAAWALYYLAAHPEVQRKVREEAEGVLGDTGLRADPAALSRLRYAEAVVNESIRLRPTSPFLIMQTARDITVADGADALHLKAGTLVMPLLTHASDADDSRYPDPGAFEPERWLSPSAPRTNGVSPFLPFGGGPRFCPGRNLALIEMTMVVAMVCHHFELEADTTAGPVGERVTFAMMPTNLGVRMHPTDRLRMGHRKSSADA
ncbi:cytochrome P450 [Streptomyces sp. NPDC001348]